MSQDVSPVYISRAIFRKNDLFPKKRTSQSWLFRRFSQANLNFLCNCLKMFEQLQQTLSKQGVLMKEGTIVDATILEAPSSTKNKQSQRDPEMHQSKKGKDWHFGMKAHIGVDAGSGPVHTVKATAANVADITMTSELLHGEEEIGYADEGYTGIEKREEATQQTKDVTWLVAKRRGGIRKMEDDLEKEMILAEEYAKAAVRSRVEHSFHFLKNLFGYHKVCYRGITKNLCRLFILFASVNLLILGRKSLAVPT